MKTVLKGKAAASRIALMAALTPKLAADAKYDPTPRLTKLTAKNFKASRAALVQGIATDLKPLLAKDASIDTDDLEKILDVVEAISPEDEDVVSDEEGDLRSFLKSKGMSEDDIGKACSMKTSSGATDEKDDEDEDDKKKAKDKSAKDKGAKDKSAKDEDDDDTAADTVTKSAMDAAITVAVRKATETANKTQRDIRDAERDVRPYVGDLAMAHDSAASVYRTALTSLGEDATEIADLPIGALKAILKHIPVPGAAKPSQARLAADSAASNKGFAERFPEASRIRSL